MKNFRWLILSFLVIILDQLSKYFATLYLVFQQPQVVIPHYFNWYLTNNSGAAFSLFATMGGWQRWFFSALSIGIVFILMKWLSSLNKKQYGLSASISLIIGGAVGNVIDRFRLSYVIDFIQIHYHNIYYYPTFNIADSAVVVGACIIIVYGWPRDKKTC